MQMLKRLFLATMIAATPVAIHAAAPAAAPAAAAATAAVTAEASSTAATESAAPGVATEVGSGAYARAQPVEGQGQPIPGGLDFQPQVTENGQYALWLNNVILLPLITIISLFVLGLMLWIVARYRAAANPVPSKTSHNTLIEVIWTLVPVFILVGISVPSIDLLAKQYAPPPADAVTVKVNGYQWYWGYEYPDHGIGEYVSNMLDEKAAEASGEPYLLAVDNRMVVPVNKTVKLIVRGADVIHSFAVPALWTKMDAVPGRLNEVTFRATREGVYYGQCSELCGVNHGYMPIAVEVVSEQAFADWVASKGGAMPGTADPGAAEATAVPAAATPDAASAAAAPAAPTATPAAAPAAAAR
ncbi:cytochrome c oxidase subunit II [Sphingomonas lacunae]|uniref:Cytochrome c oxidase subunit 2 n=1 Tax=Sphingomonas lacunae TaxID=2698828 RepID=A0A6M4ARA1_9SPHN|nr:cytochrome c oxidase subunit II [Sphingomonas lacunae]QJQ31565.1 cytochrome c oxidase subunit II [Sphingomonas lacunae]